MRELLKEYFAIEEKIDNDIKTISGYFDEFENLGLNIIRKKQIDTILGSNFPITEATFDIMFQHKDNDMAFNIEIYEKQTAKKTWDEKIKIQVSWNDRLKTYLIKDFAALKSALKMINEYQMLITKKELENILKAINEVE
jgi:hypothetical protein